MEENCYCCWSICINTFLRNIFAKYIMKALIRVLSKAGIKGALKIVKAFERPLKIFLNFRFYIVVMALKDMIYLSPKIIQRIFDSSVIILIAQGINDFGG